MFGTSVWRRYRQFQHVERVSIPHVLCVFRHREHLHSKGLYDTDALNARTHWNVIYSKGLSHGETFTLNTSINIHLQCVNWHRTPSSTYAQCVVTHKHTDILLDQKGMWNDVAQYIAILEFAVFTWDCWVIGCQIWLK